MASHQLSTHGRSQLNALFTSMSVAYNTQDRDPGAGLHFAATPTQAQTIHKEMVEKADPFMSLINVVGRRELKGEKVGLSLTGRTASRTDLSNPNNERTPKNLKNMNANGYELFETDFDIAIGYADIDEWAKFPQFKDLYMSAVREAMAIDMLTIGWHGTSVATATDINSNPLLEDVNKGWIQKLREYNSGSQILIGDGTGTGSGAATLGSTGNFKNLDILVANAKRMLPVWHRNRTDLVALISQDIMEAQEDVYYETHGNTPTEKSMLAGRITKAYGGLPAITPPFFPDGTVMVTTLKNLSIYYQESAQRRTVKDKPERNEVQEFNSGNYGYELEDEQAAGAIEVIELV